MLPNTQNMMRKYSLAEFKGLHGRICTSIICMHVAEQTHEKYFQRETINLAIK